ncbi:MAG: glycoside hydrolase family 3 N-terminal domain-containing protein, partial [Myxococcaceae bacterium]
VRGQQDANMVTIAKHFPGHGNTDADSHKGLPVMTETEGQVLEQLAPFQAAIAGGLDGLMTAHVAIPKMTGDDLPATLSPKILTGLLRKRLGFDGLVLTDELEMDAIVDRFGVGKAAVMAVAAGADMVLIPWRPEKKTEVYQALHEAAESGALPQARLDEAVRRILTAKVRRGLFDKPLPVTERLALLGTGRQVARDIARDSVTLVRTDGRSFPLRSKKRIAVITAEASLARAILSRAPTATVLVVPAYPAQGKRAGLREKAQALAQEADVVVLGMINSRQLELFTMAAATGKPVVVVTMGLPYLAEEVDEAKAVLALYSYQETSAEAAAAALFGERGTPGKLPVSLPRWPFGFGLDPVGEAQAKKAAAR